MKTLLKNSQDTKEKLHLLALNSYLHQGAHNTTFQQLADELQISQAAIYKHYKNKNELLVAAISYAAEKGAAYLLKTENPKLSAMERLRAHVERNLKFCMEERLYAVAVITLHYFAVCVPEVRKLHEEINDTRIKRFENYLLAAIRENELSHLDSAKSTAMTIHSLLMGEMIKAYLWPKEDSIKKRMERIWPAIESLLT